MTTRRIRPIGSHSVADLVTAELRRSIVSGELAPGEPFALRTIAAMLDVSFIPVREALRNLEGEGLVITRSGRSARVAPLHLDDLQAIYQLRRTIEPDVAGRSCKLISDAVLDRLAAQAVEFGEEEQTIETVYDAHHDFHAALLEPAATEWDTRILNSLWRAAERYIRIGFSKAGSAAADNTQHRIHHEELLDAFRTRDPAVVGEAVLAHLTRNEATALRALADGPFVEP